MEQNIDIELSNYKRQGVRWWVLAAEAAEDADVPGGFAALAPRRGAIEFEYPVSYSEIMWPRHVRATWIRVEDDLEVDMVVRTDAQAGPQAIWLAVSSANGLTSDDDRSIAWLSMAKDSARMLSTGLFNTPRHAPKLSQDDKDKRLRLVAKLHREAVELGIAHGRDGGMTKHIHDGIWEQMPEMGVSEKTVSQLIWQARTTIDPQTGETFLAPTTPGKAAT